LTRNKRVLLASSLVLIGIVVIIAVYYGAVLVSESNLSTSNIKPVKSEYLNFRSDGVSKIFLVSAEPKYAYWTNNDTHMDWFINGPVIHKGDPVFIVNLTVRNDYTQNDSAGIVSRVDSQNRSSLGFTVTLFDKNNHVIEALQAYPQTVTQLNVSFFVFESGETESFKLYFATGNRSIDHYEVFVAYVSSMPAP
jgi:hypothetical protein